MIMKTYSTHKEIPSALKKVILDETGGKLKNVPMAICNEIITEYHEAESPTFFEEFTVFTIEAQTKDGEELSFSATSVDEADQIMDTLIMDHDGDLKDFVMVLRQNDRLIRGFVHGQVVYPAHQLHVESNSPFKKRA